MRQDIWVSGVATDDRVQLVICEDGSDSYFVDGKGNKLANEDPYVVQKADVEPVDGEWKVSYMASERHDSFEGTECDDAG